MKRYLVTGAAGFIGANLVEKILDNGDRVVGVDNLSTGNMKNLEFIETHRNKKNYTMIKGDIRDQALCKNVMENIDYILHQASLVSVTDSSLDPSLYHENNITGTLNLLVAAKESQVKTFVTASSASVYGNTPKLPQKENTILNPQSPYAIGKLTTEQYCTFFYEHYGLKTISLRYFNVYGPKQNSNSQYATVITKFIQHYKNNTSPTIHGDGMQTRDFIYIEDVVNANLNACKTETSKAFGKPYNIGSGKKTTINDLNSKIQKIFNSNIQPQHDSERKMDVRNSQADTTLAKQNLNYKNTTPLDVGLEKTIKWYKENTD